MTIGYDAKRLFHNHTGLGYYSRTLVQSLIGQDASLHTLLLDHSPINNDFTKPFFDHINIDIIKLHSPAWYHRSIHLNPTLRDHPIDIYHGLSNELPFVRLEKNIPAVVTIHDVLFKSFHADFPWLDRQVYQLKTKTALKNASTIIAISEATKKELLHYYPNTPSHKIRVIYQSYDPIFDLLVNDEIVQSVLKEYHLPQEYILCVGSITQRKNLGILLKALSILPAEKRIPLLIAGKGTHYEKKMKTYILDHHLEKWVHFLPDLPRMKLRILYSGAQAVVYPSLGEGFGLPVLESIAANTPVITSSISSMPEAGGSLAMYFDPLHAEDLVSCLLKINKAEFQKTNTIDRQNHLKRFSRPVIADQYLKEVYLPLSK